MDLTETTVEDVLLMLPLTVLPKLVAVTMDTSLILPVLVYLVTVVAEHVTLDSKMGVLVASTELTSR